MSDRVDIPQPRPETDLDHLPSALTFYLTKAQRSQVLGTLRALDTNRAIALIKALSLPPQLTSDS